MVESTFDRRLRERREAKEREAAEQKLTAGVIDEDSPDSDLVPETKSSLSEEDREMDTVMEAIEQSGIINIYNRLNIKGFTAVARPGQTESIKARCPKPEHVDEKPAMWFNTQKNVWMCGPCNEGGDMYDIAAIKFGYPDYKTDGNSFHELRRALAEEFGYTFQKKAYESGYHILPPETDEQPAPATERAPDPEPVKPQLATVTVLPSGDTSDDDDQYFYENSRAVNHKAFVKDGTFMDEWIKATYQDSTPEDYNFWYGLTALGLAAGRNVWFGDNQGDVFGNLFLCLLGPSGVGKSRSARHLDELLTRTKGWWDPHAEPPKGVKKVPANSGEMLIKYFECHWMPDVNDPTNVLDVPVRGLADYGEFSDLLVRCNRSGSTLGTTLMDLYDCKRIITSASLTTGEKTASDPFGSLVTTTQPRMLRKLVTQDQLNSGFANRFIFVTGIPKIRDEFDYDHVDLEAASNHYRIIQTWCDTLPGKLWFADEKAKKMATEFWNDTIRPSVNSDDSQLLKRMSLVMKKMMLLVGINEMRTDLSTDQLERAFSIFDYIVRAYGISADRLGESKLGEIERLIIKTVEDFTARNKNGMTPSEFRKKFHRRKFDTQDVVRVFENLVKLGELDRLETKDSGKVGKPTIRYKVAKA